MYFIVLRVTFSCFGIATAHMPTTDFEIIYTLIESLAYLKIFFRLLLSVTQRIARLGDVYKSKSQQRLLSSKLIVCLLGGYRCRHFSIKPC